MISYLKGTVLTKKPKYLILLVNNVGYQIFANEKTLSELKEGAEANLYIHHQQKEDAQDLYGFLTLPELELFKNLVSISGVGPKSAINVLVAATVEDIIHAILSEDAELLKSVSGIGTKTAERIVIELKSKIGKLSQEATGVKATSGDSEVIEALLGLGYSRKEVIDAIRQLPKEVTDTSEKIKGVLKLMAVNK